MNLTSVLKVDLSPAQVIVSFLLAFALSFLWATVYRKTHHGISYTRSFYLTLILMSPAVAMIMMAIGSNVALSLGLGILALFLGREFILAVGERLELVAGWTLAFFGLVYTLYFLVGGGQHQHYFPGHGEHHPHEREQNQGEILRETGFELIGKSHGNDQDENSG